MRDFIPVSEPLLDGNEMKYLQEAIQTGWISSEGPFVGLFEKKFSEFVLRKHGVSVASGTAALDIAVRALGISNGDEVIIPTFTIISCAQAITNLGGVIVPVDCDLYDFNMMTDRIEALINEKTKAIMVVHIYGHPVDMNPILDIADKYNLKIIEDAAEMHGQTYYGKPCGSFGDVSIFSFYANKIISTGEGGMIVTDDDNIAIRCKYYRNLCFNNRQRFIHTEIGYNYRFTNIQAAIGLAQLERINEFVSIKREIGRKYQKMFSHNEYLRLPMESTSYSDNIFWVYPLVLSNDYSEDAAFVMNELAKAGIGTRPFFFPIHQQPVYAGSTAIKKVGDYTNAEYLYSKGFYIPSGLPLSMHAEEMNYIAEVVNRIVA